MFYKFSDEHFRYTGRWATNPDAKDPISIMETACGSKLEFRFRGKSTVLHFDTDTNMQPFPHLWVIVDGGAKTEVPLFAFIRVEAPDYGEHTVTVIHKSSMEIQHRWYFPLVGKIAFKGADADELIPLPENKKKTIEFVGDSITEGVLIDEELSEIKGQTSRPFQDDVTATYAYLTAEALGLEPYFCGYGAVGMTRPGCASVPKCADSYKYCFMGAEKNYKNCDIILINHGANDRFKTAEEYLADYEKALDLIIAENPKSKIVSLSAFCGAFHEELGKFIADYNRKNGTCVYYIDSNGWISPTPLHPHRDGHITAAEHLIPILKELI